MDADVGVFVAVWQHTRVEAGLDVLGFGRSLHFRRYLPLHVVQRKHPFLPVLNESHVRHNAVHEALLDVLRALIPLVCDDGNGLKPHLLFAQRHASADLARSLGLSVTWKSTIMWLPASTTVCTL